jgi:hypothetical protein
MGEILTGFGEKGRLAKIFKTSYVTVRAALRGKTHSELAEKIRKAAIERGGIEKQ